MYDDDRRAYKAIIMPEKYYAKKDNFMFMKYYASNSI